MGHRRKVKYFCRTRSSKSITQVELTLLRKLVLLLRKNNDFFFCNVKVKKRERLLVLGKVSVSVGVREHLL